MKSLHRELSRLARRMRNTRDEAARDQLFRQMMDIWKKVDNLIVDRPIKQPPNLWDEDSLARFR